MANWNACPLHTFFLWFSQVLSFLWWSLPNGLYPSIHQELWSCGKRGQLPSRTWIQSLLPEEAPVLSLPHCCTPCEGSPDGLGPWKFFFFHMNIDERKVLFAKWNLDGTPFIHSFLFHWILETVLGKDSREQTLTDTVTLKRKDEYFTCWHVVSFCGAPESMTIIREVWLWK